MAIRSLLSGNRACCWLAALAACLLAVNSAPAQDGGMDPSSNLQGVAGVVVDADGTLRLVTKENNRRLQLERLAAAKAALDPQVAKPSELRLVSLTRLEQAVGKQLDAGRQPTDDMRFLAGLTRIKYVFLYPESGDIVIAGPAEGWVPDVAGRVVGIATGRPMLELEDLIVALRTFAPYENDAVVIGCSIDPTQEGLARLQDFSARTGGHATPDQTLTINKGLKTALGLQQVSVLGVPGDTHFAQVMVEADYRMKLIGIGLERAPLKGFKTWVERVSPASMSKNALVRWYFTPDYKCLRVSDDLLAMELVGEGVKLVGEDELVTGSGQRKASGATSGASKGFVTAFTERYPELAARSPVFAQLRNLIDMSVVGAFMRKYDYFAKVGWDMPVFGDEGRYAVQTKQTPLQVESAIHAIWKGNRLSTPIGGGVHVEPTLALASENVLADEEARVQTLRAQTELSLADGQWWWDAE